MPDQDQQQATLIAVLARAKPFGLSRSMIETAAYRAFALAIYYIRRPQLEIALRQYQLSPISQMNQVQQIKQMLAAIHHCRQLIRFVRLLEV